LNAIDHASRFEFVQVMRQGRRDDILSFSDFARRNSLIAHLKQQQKHVQPRSTR